MAKKTPEEIEAAIAKANEVAAAAELAAKEEAELAALAKAEEEETAEEVASTEGLIKMKKQGEHLHVHPSTIKAHKDAGWEVA